MKIITWNVNGIRAALQKGLLDFIKTEDADIFCIQETKAQPDQVDLSADLPEYFRYWNSAEKKGYSGTAVFSKIEPLDIILDIDTTGHDTEGRSITLEFSDFYLVTNYTPNAQPELARIDYRLEWEAANRKFLTKLDAKKPLVLCGDLNVAHKEIDLTYPDANRGNPGFSDQEREAFTELLSLGFTDAYRYLYPDKEEAYTWWSYRTRARDRNIGWRIDYFVLSDRLVPKLKDVIIRSDIYGSDHCPVVMKIDI